MIAKTVKKKKKFVFITFIYMKCLCVNIIDTQVFLLLFNNE